VFPQITSAVGKHFAAFFCGGKECFPNSPIIHVPQPAEQPAIKGNERQQLIGWVAKHLGAKMVKVVSLLAALFPDYS
jgi:hypothetical protein